MRTFRCVGAFAATAHQRYCHGGGAETRADRPQLCEHSSSGHSRQCRARNTSFTGCRHQQPHPRLGRTLGQIMSRIQPVLPAVPQLCRRRRGRATRRNPFRFGGDGRRPRNTRGRACPGTRVPMECSCSLSSMWRVASCTRNGDATSSLCLADALSGILHGF